MRHFSVETLVRDIGLRLISKNIKYVNFLRNREYPLIDSSAKQITNYLFIPKPNKEQLMIGSLFGNVISVAGTVLVDKDNVKVILIVTVRLSIVGKEIYLLSMIRDNYDETL